MMRPMVALAKRSRTVVAGKGFSTRVQKQMCLETAWIAERFAANEADVVTTDEALAHEHVIEVAVVTEDALLAVPACEDRIGRVDVDMSDERLERVVNNTTFGAVGKKMTLSVHVMIHLEKITY